MGLPARLDDNTILMEGVQIIFRNFEGRKEKYNNEGDRNFSVLMPEPVALEMQARGFNVKPLRKREEDDPQMYHLKVKVAYNNRPPRIVMVTSRGRNTLLEEHLHLLDWADIDGVDLIINPWAYDRTDQGGSKGVSAYAKSVFVKIREDYLDQKYSHLPEIGHDPYLAIEPGPDADIIDAESWEVVEEPKAIEA